MLSLKQQYKWLQSQVSRQSQPYLLGNYLEKLNDNKKVVWQRSKKWFHLQRNYCLTTHWIQTKLWSNVVKFMHSDFKGKFYAPAFSISIRFPCKHQLKRVLYTGFHFRCQHFPVINGEWRQFGWFQCFCSVKCRRVT